MSKPIVVIVCMVRSSESWEPQQRPHPWHRCAGGGAVHSIKLRHSEPRGPAADCRREEVVRAICQPIFEIMRYAGSTKILLLQASRALVCEPMANQVDRQR